jgi:phosphatidylethanolamine-binding protein (PEBP) family uncharacterized protein
VVGLASLLAGIVVSAPFPNGGAIPRVYTCDGADKRPAITVTTKLHARVIAVEVDDIDAPGGVFVHWLAAGPVQGRNTFGKIGYSGPCPPSGDPPHRYVFHVYALNHALRLARGFSAAQLHAAMRGHVVASGKIVGRYGR